MAAFATMLNCELTPGTPQILERLKPHHEISGVIGISGELSGTVILSTDRGVAEKATQVMFDTTGDVSDDEIIDVIGELTNMVAGGAKAELELANMCLALPAVIMGTDHCIALGSRVEPVLLPFASKWGPLAVQFGFLEPAGQLSTSQRNNWVHR